MPEQNDPAMSNVEEQEEQATPAPEKVRKTRSTPKSTTAKTTRAKEKASEVTIIIDPLLVELVDARQKIKNQTATPEPIFRLLQQAVDHEFRDWSPLVPYLLKTELAQESLALVAQRLEREPIGESNENSLRKVLSTLGFHLPSAISSRVQGPKEEAALPTSTSESASQDPTQGALGARMRAVALASNGDSAERRRLLYRAIEGLDLLAVPEEELTVFLHYYSDVVTNEDIAFLLQLPDQLQQRFLPHLPRDVHGQVVAHRLRHLMDEALTSEEALRQVTKELGSGGALESPLLRELFQRALHQPTQVPDGALAEIFGDYLSASPLQVAQALSEEKPAGWVQLWFGRQSPSLQLKLLAALTTISGLLPTCGRAAVEELTQSTLLPMLEQREVADELVHAYEPLAAWALEQFADNALPPSISPTLANNLSLLITWGAAKGHQSQAYHLVTQLTTRLQEAESKVHKLSRAYRNLEVQFQEAVPAAERKARTSLLNKISNGLIMLDWLANGPDAPAEVIPTGLVRRYLKSLEQSLNNAGIQFVGTWDRELLRQDKEANAHHYFAQTIYQEGRERLEKRGLKLAEEQELPEDRKAMLVSDDDAGTEGA